MKSFINSALHVKRSYSMLCKQLLHMKTNLAAYDKGTVRDTLYTVITAFTGMTTGITTAMLCVIGL